MKTKVRLLVSKFGTETLIQVMAKDYRKLITQAVNTVVVAFSASSSIKKSFAPSLVPKLGPLKLAFEVDATAEETGRAGVCAA
ncbi:hypothetical protein [Oceanicaulis alexandrii]|uniref:hypothetical protein n=1 Tax=Oceanicaulis alexandrii TaxID=153233 RepID=UPI0003B6CB1F|nr:hypothetical protein [Oceanicaulis alexandrii]